ncbi:hypothetical protein ASE49_05340 [Novosphingobium sp. Leaf2]|nr:hypothetical protein ASE49_05340 [Novosphingobium sp. Leaf2]
MTTGRRGNGRLHVRLPARLVTHTATRQVVLSDLSCNGARVLMHEPLAIGCEVVLEWDRFDAFGTVVWCHADRSGIAFIDPVEKAVLIATRALDDRARLPQDRELVRQVAKRWVEGSARL